MCSIHTTQDNFHKHSSRGNAAALLLAVAQAADGWNFFRIQYTPQRVVVESVGF